jgi:hypothetical protein
VGGCVWGRLVSAKEELCSYVQFVFIFLFYNKKAGTEPDEYRYSQWQSVKHSGLRL